MGAGRMVTMAAQGAVPAVVVLWAGAWLLWPHCSWKDASAVCADVRWHACTGNNNGCGHAWVMWWW